MRKELKSSKAKKKEKEYMLSLKLFIVNEIEQGKLSVEEAKRKYGVLQKSTIMGWLLQFGSF